MASFAYQSPVQLTAAGTKIMRTLHRVLMITIVAFTVGTAPARAAQIVTNGGFETFTGTYPAQIATGWTMTPFDVADAVTLGGNPHSGQAAIAFGLNLDTYPALVDGELDQVLQTVVGATYTLTFWLKMVTTVDHMKVEFGDTTLMDLTNKATPYTKYTYTAVATQTSTDLQFYGYDKNSYMYLDDVSVTGAAAVPEPSSWVSLSACLAGLVLARCTGLVRRRSATRPG